jgi:ParB family chromosome partitioning protein
VCYEQRGNFAGGAYHPVLKRVDAFLDKPLRAALEVREGWAGRVLAIEERVAEIIAGLREKGLQSPYLRNFVVARLNPLRFQRGAKAELEDTLQKMEQAAKRFNVDKITPGDLARSAAAGAASGEPEA